MKRSMAMFTMNMSMEHFMDISVEYMTELDLS